MDKRISRDDMFFELARSVAKRSTCRRKQIGAVIVPKRGIALIGYNGAPSGLAHCLDVGCLIGPDGGCIRTQHAEANAIAWAAREGVALDRATMYTTISPCLACAKMIINAGIKWVFYLEQYRDEHPLQYLQDAGVTVAIHYPEHVA
jgi:dCMP deaminase